MLQTKGLQYQYENAPILSFPDIQCEKGDNLLILGQSGCGKTTLLNLLAGLLTAQHGEININGQNINTLSTRQLDRFRGKNIGIVFQKPHFVQAITVLENIMLASKLAKSDASKQRALYLLQKLGISHKAGSYPKALSSGEQQRASIARALLNRPALLLADEPSSALDDFHCEQVIGLLRDAALEDGATLVVVTHDQRIKNIFPKTIQL
jgi:ABC-type lipoprotein export system ATPase subunit